MYKTYAPTFKRSIIHFKCSDRNKQALIPALLENNDGHTAQTNQTIQQRDMVIYWEVLLLLFSTLKFNLMMIYIIHRTTLLSSIPHPDLLTPSSLLPPPRACYNWLVGEPNAHSCTLSIIILVLISPRRMADVKKKDVIERSAKSKTTTCVWVAKFRTKEWGNFEQCFLPRKF